MAANDLIKVWVLVSFYDENGLHKAGSVAYVKEEEFNPNYMKKIDVPSGGGSLEDLSDVDISSVDDGQILMYDAATQKWVNVTGGGGGSTITNIYADTDTGNVASMDIDGTEYEFGAGETTIENIQVPSSYVQSMEIDGDTYTFSTVEYDQPAYDSDILASVDLNGNSYKLFYLDNFQYNNDGYVTSFDDGDSNNYAFCNVGNVDTDSEGKVKSMDINGSSAEFVSIENISTQGPNGEVDAMDINGSSYSFATGGSVIENIDTQGPNGEVSQMDIDSQTYTFYTGSGIDELVDLDDVNVSSPSDGQVLKYDGTSQKWVNGSAGGGGGSSLVVTLTATTGTTIDLATMSAQSSASVNADKTYAEMKAADDIVFKIVDTNQSGGQKWTLRPTGMHTLNVAADQGLFFTFTVLAPGGNSLKIFRLEVGPWGNYFTLGCIA